MTVLFGPDLSHFHGGISVARIAAEGCAFLIAKVSQGAGFRDVCWPSFRDDARRYNLLIAGYHMVDQGDPDAQAANCRAALGDSSTPLALDWEGSGGGGSWSNFVAVHRAFIRAGLNVRLAYAPRSYWQQQGSADMSGVGLPLWASHYVPTSGLPLAQYQQVPAAWWADYGGAQVALIQFTDHAQIAGHQVDCSAFRGTKDQLAALLTGPPRTVASAPTTEVDVSSLVVLPIPPGMPSGSYRLATTVEGPATGSKVAAAMWISYTALYGDATVTVTALDGAGNVLDHTGPTPLLNNHNAVYTPPALARTVTLEGRGLVIADRLVKPAT